MRIFPLYIIILLLACSCSDDIVNSEIELLNWVNNDDNGLIKTKSIYSIKIEFKYLPPAYLASRDASGNPEIFDSLLNIYNTSYSFLMTIGPNEEEGADFDIMFAGVADYKEYDERVKELNFNIKEYVCLNTAEKEYLPVLSNLENIYGLNKSRTIYLVFAKDKETDDLFDSETIDVTYNDELFSTGIHHFVFNKSDLNKIPKLELINK